MKKRKSNVKTERAGLLAVEGACNKLDLIWRDLLEEDVGMDGTIEIGLGQFPTGKLVGAQIKSGDSYIRSETERTFRFYANADDVEYWLSLSIPLFVFVHQPSSGLVFWVDVKKYFQEIGEGQVERNYIEFSKSNLLNEEFENYLKSLFDLIFNDDDEYASIKEKLENIVYKDGEGDSEVVVSALSLFIEGLWGMCSKVQFHSSLLSDIIRKKLRERDAAVVLRYTFSRTELYPFFISYFNILSGSHLAKLDISEINNSLYSRLEYPAFIAILTVNGRRFVDYLRRSGLPNVRDNQFLTLAVIPHVQIEVYSSCELQSGVPRFGAYTDVLGVSFNALLDYYHVEHWRRESEGESAAVICSQTMFYYEIRDYLNMRFCDIPKDNFIFIYKDTPLSPLICWLEEWNDNRQTMQSIHLGGKTNVEQFGFHSEFVGIFSSAGVMTVSEPPMPSFPDVFLANGERVVLR